MHIHITDNNRDMISKKQNSIRYSMRSNDQNLLEIPRISTNSYGKRSFYFAAPHLWNDLPLPLRTCQKIDTFKTLLKTHLFRKAFYDKP